MNIRQVSNRERNAYNKVVTHPVQSWEWGEFREKTGNKILRLGLYDRNRLVEGYLLTLHQLPYTNSFVAMFAKGPAPTQAMLKSLRDWAKRENIIFVRIEPDVAITHKNAKRMLKLFKTFKMHTGRPFFNKSTYEINLTKSEEQLLKDMRPKTRYNIRLAERHGVQVVEDNSEESFARYLALMDETTKRQNYFAHTERYHKLMWETLRLAPARSGQAPIAHLLKAVYQGKTIVCWILFVWKDKLYYPYGASSTEHRNVMAPHLLMWEAIKFGKNLELKRFDLWGSDDAKGYTKFKEGFRPENIEYLGTWDLPVNKKLYYAYRIAEELRWKFLKLRGRFVPLSSFR